MVLIPVRCPYCQSDQVIKGGKTATGKQRYRCQQPTCPHRSFLLNPAYKGRSPEIKQQVIDVSLNGSGIRDTARVLQISPTTVLKELKKRGCALLSQPTPDRDLEPAPCCGCPPTRGRSRGRRNVELRGEEAGTALALACH